MNKDTIVQKIKEVITPGQEWILDNLQYMTIMGSQSYGINHENSDTDIYAVTIPPKEYVYPSMFGYIYGFDIFPTFNQFQVQFKKGQKKDHLDVVIYSITKYFSLVFDNNPNMIDSLFTPDNCVLICSSLFKKVRSQRHLFLHKGCFHKFKGYAYSQLRKIKTNPDERVSEERKELITKFGYDVKFALHIFRLLNECEQILTGQSLNLQQNKEELKLIRQGFYSLSEIHQRFKDRELQLENLYNNSSLPWGKETNQDKIKELLTLVLEEFYDSTS